MDLTTGLKWNSGRGNRLLILHLIGPDGLVTPMERIWIRKSGKIQCEDYHNDICAKDFYEWFKKALDTDILPLDSVVVMDNASIHNKVIYYGVLKTVWMQLNLWYKIVRMLWTTVLVTIFLHFNLKA